MIKNIVLVVSLTSWKVGQWNSLGYGLIYTLSQVFLFPHRAFNCKKIFGEMLLKYKYSI